MNVLSKRTLSVAAATAALTVVALVQSQAAQAFLITRSAGPNVPANVNPSLSPPTVIDFNALNGVVPTTPTSISPGGPNGGATLERSGSADYGSLFFPTNGLRVGGGGSGQVSFKFDDPRGMGYFGLFFSRVTTPLANLSVSFRSGGSLSPIRTFTGTELFATGSGNYFNFFVTNNNEIFDEVLLADASSSLLGGSFIVDNVAYQAIPTPALLPGLLGLAFGVVRKRKAEAEAEA
jgi:hypothetical protein